MLYRSDALRARIAAATPETRPGRGPRILGALGVACIVVAIVLWVMA